MYFLIGFGILLLLIINYVTWFREWLKSRPWPWSQRYFKWIEPIEIFLYRKSETTLFARTLMLFGILPPVLDQLQMFNNPVLIELLPDKWERWAPLAFTVIGIIVELLRRGTKTPIEVVELPTVGNTPAVNAAVANLEVAKVEAIAAVAVEKAEKK